MSKMYIHVGGINGSGKTYAMKTIIAKLGGVSEVVERYDLGSKVRYSTVVNTDKVILMGKYGDRERTYGMDTVRSPVGGLDLARELLGSREDLLLLSEGLLIPPIERCETYAKLADSYKFILLDTPFNECVANVEARRKFKLENYGRIPKSEEVDTNKLAEVAKRCESWLTRATAAGLDIVKMNHTQLTEYLSQEVSKFSKENSL